MHITQETFMVAVILQLFLPIAKMSTEISPHSGLVLALEFRVSVVTGGGQSGGVHLVHARSVLLTP